LTVRDRGSTHARARLTALVASTSPSRRHHGRVRDGVTRCELRAADGMAHVRMDCRQCEDRPDDGVRDAERRADRARRDAVAQVGRDGRRRRRHRAKHEVGRRARRRVGVAACRTGWRRVEPGRTGQARVAAEAGDAQPAFGGVCARWARHAREEAGAARRGGAARVAATRWAVRSSRAARVGEGDGGRPRGRRQQEERPSGRAQHHRATAEAQLPCWAHY
jgi:hypothetical protein